MLDKNALEKNLSSDPLVMILVGANIVNRETIDEATKNAKAMGLSLERALIMSGLASEYLLRPALVVDQKVKDGEISVDRAIKALRLARTNQMDVGEAIQVLTSVDMQTAAVANVLTNLLIAASMIDEEQLAFAIKKSQETKLKLGRILVLNRQLSSWMMMAALCAQILVRDEKITTEQAIQGLHAVGRRRVSIEQALFELGIYMEQPGQIIKLGELFAMAGYINESDMLECLETEIVKEKQFGQILLEQGLVIQSLLEASILLQDMVANDILKAYEAAEALKQMRDRDVSVYQVVAELRPPPQLRQAQLTFIELLAQSGFVDSEQVHGLVDPEETKPVQIGKTILASGIIDETTLYNALRCYSLLKEGCLSNERAVEALKLCHNGDIPLDDALPGLGANVPARMQWMWL